MSSVVLVGVLFVFVFPTSSLLAQRRDRAAVATQLRSMTTQNRQLEQRIQRLLTQDEIERTARAKYNLVRPGEEAFAILPPRATRPASAKRAGERTRERTHDEGLWARVWGRASALF
jgi:hypothetical protein